jgi:hypothetical protein
MLNFLKLLKQKKSRFLAQLSAKKRDPLVALPYQTTFSRMSLLDQAAMGEL